MINYIVLAILAVAAICLIIGLFVGYVKLSYWGGAVIGTVIITRLLKRLVPVDVSFTGFNVYGIVLLLTSVAVLLILAFLFSRVKHFINHAMEEGKKLSHYRNAAAREENESQIQVALEHNDKKTYRRLSKKKFHESVGAWGVVNRIFGGLTLAINAAVLLLIICSTVLFAVDMAQINMLTGVMSELLAAPLWTEYGAKLALDLLVVSLTWLCLKTGYKEGLLTSLVTLFMLALIGGVGYLSYHLAFNVGAYVELAQKLTDGAFAGIVANLGDMLAKFNLEPIIIAQVVIMVGQFLLLLIPVIIAGIFIPRLVDKARETKAVGVVDGVLGAIVSYAITFVILSFVGALVYQINDVSALASFNSYMDESAIANSLYKHSFFLVFEFVTQIPIREWFNLA